MTEKPNKEFWALKARIDEWKDRLLLYAFVGLVTGAFGGAILGHLIWEPGGGAIGFILGGVSAQIGLAVLTKKTIGHVLQSKEECQKCRTPYGSRGMTGGSHQLDDICSYCGNDNRIDLHDS